MFTRSGNDLVKRQNTLIRYAIYMIETTCLQFARKRMIYFKLNTNSKLISIFTFEVLQNKYKLYTYYNILTRGRRVLRVR